MTYTDDRYNKCKLYIVQSHIVASIKSQVWYKNILSTLINSTRVFRKEEAPLVLE